MNKSATIHYIDHDDLECARALVAERDHEAPTFAATVAENLRRAGHAKGAAHWRRLLELTKSIERF